jgi:Family of unknown function (DUF695)
MSILSSILGLLGCGRSTPEDQWTVATGEDNGKPMIVRYRSDTPRDVEITKYPHLLAISWKYEPASDNGMPSKEDNDRMVLFEELLDAVESHRTAYLTVSVTCNGVKEWQWYSRNLKETMAAINKALSGRPPFPINISQQEDPEWSAYFGFKNRGK